MVRGLTVTFVVFCLVTSLIVGAAIWLFYTSAGADFTLRHLAQQLDARITISQLSGSLARGFSIKELEIEHADVSLQARRIELGTAVSSLYPLHLSFPVLVLADIRLNLPETESAGQQPGVALQIPQLPGMFDLLHVDITQLDLTNMSITQGDDTWVIENLQAAIGFHQRRLSVNAMSLRVDDLFVAATLTLDVKDSVLDLAATVENTMINQSWEKIMVATSLAAVAADTSAGTIDLQLQLVELEPFFLKADVRLGDSSLTFADLLLRQAGRSGSVKAAGQLQFDEVGPALTVNVFPQDLDLSQEASLPLVVNGEIGLTYARMQYQGRLDLTTRGNELVVAALTADVSGDHQHLQLRQINASWLAAQISGNLDLDWSETLELAAQLRVEHLSLEPFIPDSSSLLNANLSTSYRHDEQSPQAYINVELYDSTLYEYPLSGMIAADYKNDNLILHQLNLLSNSAQLQAQGDLKNNINLTLTLQQVADFYPSVAGALSVQGWFNQGNNGSAVDLQFVGTDLVYDQWQLGALSSHLRLDVDQTLFVTAQLRQLGSEAQSLLVDGIDLQVGETLISHQIGISARAQDTTMKATLQASWSESLWTALLQQLNIDAAGRQWHLNHPASLTVGLQMIRVSQLLLDAGLQQSVRLQGVFMPAEESLEVDLGWSNLPLSFFSHWLDPALVQGVSGGSLSVLHQPENTQLHLFAQLNADLHYRQLHLQDTSTRLTLDWGMGGLAGDVRVDTGSPAHLILNFDSPDPAGLVLPDMINMALACRQVPLQLIQPWLPADIIAQGIFTCDMEGWWSADKAFALHGKADISAGSLYWYDDEQEMEVAVEKAGLELSWQEKNLRAQATLIHDFGYINSHLEVGIPAQVPINLLDHAPIAADISLLLHESGLLTVFFPQYIYDSKGEIELTAAISGTVGEPLFAGTLGLQGAELYVPAAGIRIADIHAAAQLEGQQLNISTLRMTSADGTVSGQGRLDLQGWSPDSYYLTLSGKGFQLINLSDLSIQVSPDLVIDGNFDTIRVRGSLQFPQVMIEDQTRSQIVQNSPDLVIVDRHTPERRITTLRHDIDVNLILGDQVLLNFAGLQARVAGSLRLYSDAQQDIAAQGQLTVERGRFSTYGVSLDIERGDLYFAGVPLRYPTLDILAIRRAGEVRAGVRVTGTPQEPQISLYSEPTMPDADVLSYVVLGRPLDSRGGDTDLLMVATGALLSQGESVILQERLKGRLGLDVLEFNAGNGDTNDAVITTGKYITPDLYVSLGYSLFNNSNEIRIRYRLSSRLELESNFGQESGVDLFYRLEKDQLIRK
jgi:translocation and assembly module TamB